MVWCRHTLIHTPNTLLFFSGVGYIYMGKMKTGCQMNVTVNSLRNSPHFLCPGKQGLKCVYVQNVFLNFQAEDFWSSNSKHLYSEIHILVHVYWCFPSSVEIQYVPEDSEPLNHLTVSRSQPAPCMRNHIYRRVCTGDCMLLPFNDLYNAASMSQRVQFNIIQKKLNPPPFWCECAAEFCLSVRGHTAGSVHGFRKLYGYFW